MTDKLNQALNNVQVSYNELIEIANNMLSPIIDPANELVNVVSARSTCLTIDQLRDFILQLQLKAFEISEIKEKSTLKAELAEALQKEKQATEFNLAEGTATAKTNTAIINSSAETVTETLYNLVANLLKTKLDQLHRLVDCLKSILMSRMQETKFMNLGTSSEVANNDGRVFEQTKGQF